MRALEAQNLDRQQCRPLRSGVGMMTEIDMAHNEPTGRGHTNPKRKRAHFLAYASGQCATSARGQYTT